MVLQRARLKMRRIFFRRWIEHVVKVEVLDENGKVVLDVLYHVGDDDNLCVLGSGFGNIADVADGTAR